MKYYIETIDEKTLRRLDRFEMTADSDYAAAMQAAITADAISARTFLYRLEDEEKQHTAHMIGTFYFDDDINYDELTDSMVDDIMRYRITSGLF